jgi:TPR repeat protein
MKRILLALVMMCSTAFSQKAEDYRAAAEKGNAKAQFNLAICYATGEGVPQDDVRAYAICLHAKLNGYDVLKVEELVELLSLTLEQRHEGQQLAKTLFID